MSRIFILATLTAAALTGSALAGEANLFGKAAAVDGAKLFGANSNAQLLSSGGASTMSVQTTTENSLFGNSTSSAGASEIGKSAMAGFAAESNNKAAFSAATANSSLLTK